MSKLPIDVKQFKKVRFDSESTTLRHMKDGHEIKLAHGALSPEIKSQLSRLPVHKFSEGGEAEQNSTPVPSKDDLSDVQSDQPVQNNTPHPPDKPDSPGILGAIKNRFDEVNDPTFMAKAQYAQEARDKGYSDPEVQDLVQKQFQDDSGIPQEPLQASAAPQTAQAQPQNQDPYGLSSYEKGMTGALGQQLAGQTQELAAQGQEGKDIAQAQSKRAQDDQKAFADYTAARAPIEQKVKEGEDWLSQNPENAHRYIDNMSTGGKIKTAIGLLLGGIGAGLTHGPNMAAQFLQKQIDNDIDAQRSQIGTKKGLLSHYMQEGLNARDAYQMAKIQNNQVLLSALGAAQGKAQSAASAGMIQNVRGIIGLETEKMKHDMTIQRMQLGSPSQEGTYQNAAGRISMLAPPAQKEALMKDLQTKQNMDKANQDLIQAFDYAAKNNTVMGKLNPQNQSRLQAIVDSKLIGLAHASAGRFNMEEIPFMRAQFPKATDDPESIAVKRQNFINSLNEKSSFPSLQPFGIHGSTTQQQTSSPMEGKIARAPGKPALIMKGGQWVPYNG